MIQHFLCLLQNRKELIDHVAHDDLLRKKRERCSGREQEKDCVCNGISTVDH